MAKAKDQTSTPSGALTTPEGQPTKRIEWSDLTKDQQALLKDFLKNGIHLTPEQILKIASGEIEYHPPPKSLDGEIVAVHIGLERDDGHTYPAIEARRVEVGLGHKNKANPDFATFWSQKDMSAALSLPKGYISLTAHGGTHYIKQELRSYDVEALLAAFIGVYYARRGRLPKEMKFTREIRERAAAMYDLVAIAKGITHKRSAGGGLSH